MGRQSIWRGVPRAVAAAGLLWMIGATAPVEARGGHGFHHGIGGLALHAGGASFAGVRRHDDDAYVKAASQEEDKLLNTKIKSICRGC